MSRPRRDRLADVRVVAGEFDQRREDEEQQVFAVKTVSVHQKYHHAAPMTYDIALIELDQHIRFGRFPFELLCFLMRSLFYPLVTFLFLSNRSASKSNMPSFPR